MSKVESLQRQLEIIKIAKKGPFKWDLLKKHLDRKTEERGYYLSISKRTLPRDLKEISTIFGLSIQFDFKSKSYYVNEEESLESNMELLESFETIQAFKNGSSLKGKVFFETRLAKGTEYLKPILDAIDSQRAIQVTYEKFWLWELENRTLKPIALKQFKHRWYMFVWDESNLLKNFGLDRIRSLEILDDPVQFPVAPDLEARFAETFGVINFQDEPLETIVLTFTEFKGRYIKSMPWHESQSILVDDGKILTISLQVKINYELISEILSHGDEVRVDAPERLKNMIKNKVANILKNTVI
jgi:predicted DNA-binding transcriptional regulator YafY